MDTNALMMPVECDVRVFEELERALDVADPELLVPAAVLAELEKLSDGAGEEATAASVGLDLARERCRIVDHEAEYADDAVVEVATGGANVAADGDEKAVGDGEEDGGGDEGADAVTHAVTNDRPLVRRLLDAGVPVVSLRTNDKLAVTQP